MVDYVLLGYIIPALLILLVIIMMVRYFNFLNSIAKIKDNSWLNFRKLAKKEKLNIQKDKFSSIGLPLLNGKLNKKRFSVRIINENQAPIDKIEFFIELKSKIPNIIWITSKHLQKNFAKNKYFNEIESKKMNNHFIFNSNNSEILNIFMGDRKFINRLLKIDKNSNFYSLLITSKSLKYYSLDINFEEDKIIEKINLLIDLSNYIDKILQKNLSIQIIPKSLYEEFIDKRTKKALKINLFKIDYTTPPGYISLFGSGIFLILFGIWIIISNPFLLGKITAMALIIPIGILIIIFGYLSYYYWKKWSIHY